MPYLELEKNGLWIRGGGGNIIDCGGFLLNLCLLLSMYQCRKKGVKGIIFHITPLKRMLWPIIRTVSQRQF